MKLRCLKTAITTSIVIPGQLSLLPTVGREVSTGQSAVMLCGWEKSRMSRSIRG